MTGFAFLDSAALRAALGTYADTAVHLYDTLDSTNTEAKRRAAEDRGPALYIARTQSAGRGRLGRSFHSPADTGLYMTLSYTTPTPLGEAVHITAMAAVATVAAVEALTDRRPGIKWVNDLYLDRGGTAGKLAGILAEAVTLPAGGTRILVGIGLNLSTEAFPSGLRAPAASLFTPAEAHRVTPAFCGTLAGEITRRLLALRDGAADALSGGEGCLAFYRRHLLFVGERVLCTRGREAFEATLLGVDEAYSLLVDRDGVVTALSSGEISVRIAHP